MTFDVVIPTYNNLEELRKCIDGFVTQTFSDFRIIVCVNGYEDGTLEYLYETEFPLTIIVCEHANKKNNGRPANRNLSLGHISATYICFFDSDLVPHPNLLRAHLDLLNSYDCVSAGGVKYLDKNNDWAQYLTTRGAYKFKDKAEIPFKYFNTQNIAFNAFYFTQLNGFDAKINSYGGDDTEFSYRLHKQYTIPTIKNGDAVAEGIMNKTLKNALFQMREFGSSSLPYIINKHPEFKEIFNIKIYNSLHVISLYNILNTPLVYNILIKCTKISPIWVKIKIIHLLVFKNIFEGFLKQKKDPLKGLL